MRSKLNSAKALCCLLLIGFFCLKVNAQFIQTTINIPPPYPIHYEDYIQFNNQTIITLTNTSNETKQIKLLTTITGDNGIQAAMKQSYVPTAPITLNPMETRVLTGGQLKAINLNITESDIDVQGIPMEKLIQTEALPEGNYTVCVEPFDFNTNESLASPAGFGCANIWLTHYDPPDFILPAFDAQVPPTVPQFVNFVWTPVGVAIYTRYRFQIVDMNLNNLQNPNDAFSNLAVQLHFQKDDILIPNMQYDLSMPPLQKGHQYAIRVTAYDPGQNIMFKNDGHSPVSVFTYDSDDIVVIGNPIDNDNVINDIVDNPAPNIDVVDIDLNDFPIINQPPNNDDNNDPPQDMEGCTANCEINPAPVGPSKPINQNQPVNVGLFQMQITQLNGQNGEGTIHVPFLKTNVKTTFTGLTVNANNTMIGGQVFGKIDPGSVVTQAVANSENANLQTMYDQLPQLLNEVNNNAKKVSMFNGQNEEDSPLTGIPFSLDNSGMDMTIVGMIFNPTNAYMNVVMGFETLPGALTPYLGIGESGLSIRPGGFCDNVTGTIGLPSNKDLDLVNNGGQDWVKMKFYGGGNNTKTYASFNCTGVYEVKIDAELVLGRDHLLAVNGQGDVQNNANVAVEIKKTLNNNFQDWLIESPTIKPTGHFTLPALQGFVMTAENLVFDHHGNQEAENMQFHPNHPYKGADSKLWKGLFIEQLSLKFPEGFKKDNQDLQITVHDLLIDKTGFWGKTVVDNLISIESGDLGGWAFSIDQFSLDVEESSLTGGGFAGNIELPITEFGIPYDIVLSEDQNGNSYNFGISPNTEFEVDMWIAQFVVGNSSSIGIEKIGNTFKPKAIIHGDLSIGWNPEKANGMQNKPAVKKFNLPTLGIEGMEITTNNNQPKITKFGLPSLDNIDLPQGELFAFKINLNGLEMVENQQFGNGLQISLGLGFDNGGNADGDPLIGGAGTFTFFPEIVNKKFKFKKVKVDEIQVGATVGPAEIEGGIILYSDDATYGDGFRGFVNVSMPPLGLDAMNFTLQVGTAPENFRYWMFDASIKLTSGIPCGPGVAIYGLGGGGWFNMSREGPENVKDNASTTYNDMVNVDGQGEPGPPGQTANGVTYTPSDGTMGFKANVIIGLVGSSAAFNADVGLAIQFSDYYGVEYIEFNGSAYLMQKMSNRGEALVTGGVTILVEMANENNPNGTVLTGSVSIGINVNSLVDVNANLHLGFMFSENAWYVNFGEWDTNANPGTYEPQNDPLRNHIGIEIDAINVTVDFNCYFMIGTEVPPNLPPLPKNVQNFFPGGAKEPPGMAALTSSGLGFATGAGVHLDVHISFAILYADIVFDMGFDALVRKLDGDCGQGGTAGIDGWYAKGQAYAYCHVAGGLEIDLWFFSGKAEFLAFTAGALLKMQGPNPTWINGRVKFEVSILGGLIKVNTQVVADIGEKCDPGAGSPFDDIPIVSFVDPPDKAKKVHCYTDPQVIFNFHNEPFALEVIDEQTDEVEKRGYSIEVLEVKFWYTDEETNEEVQIELSKPYYANDGYSCKYLPKDAFPGLTDVSYKVRTQGHEHKMNGYLVSNQIIKSFEEQIVEGTFKTDTLPDVIELENIVYSIPGLAQRYFLKDEEPMGKIQLGQQGCSTLFRTENEDNPDEMYIYKTKFIELATNNEYETDCQCNDFLVTYDIPPELKNGKIYQLDFIRRTMPKNNQNSDSKSNENWRKIGDWANLENGIALPLNYNDGNGNGGGNNNNGINNIKIPNQNPNNGIKKGIVILPPNMQGPNQIQNNNNNNMQGPNQIQANNNNGGNGNNGSGNGMSLNLNIKNNDNGKLIAMEVYDREFVESLVSIKTVDKILFTNYFKTSKYNTRSEKVNQMSEHPQIFSANYPLPPAHFEGFGGYNHPDDFQVEVPLMLLKTNEGFDWYDVKGYFYSAIDPQELEEYGNEQDLYNINPPIFPLERADETWLQNGPYRSETNKYSAYSVFHQPDKQEYKFEMEIWDPTDLENPVPYHYFNPGDLRPYIYWPDNWALHYPAFFEEGEMDDIGNVFWGGDRYDKLSYYDHLGNLNGAPHGKYRKPFAQKNFQYVPKELPTPQNIAVQEDFIPCEWYRVGRHGAVDFGGLPIAKIENNLGWGEINAEKAKAPQNNNNGGNGMQANNNVIQNNPNNNGNGLGINGFNIQNNPTKYIPVINFSEWMAKRDHIRLTNKLLFDFRQEVCTGCGHTPGEVLIQKDFDGQGYGQYDENNKPQDWNNDGIPDIDYKDFPYTYQYLPLRAYLLKHKLYKGRPTGNYNFVVGDKEFSFLLPKMDTEGWTSVQN